MYEISVEINRNYIVEKIFKILEKEVVFHRGRIKTFQEGNKLRIVGYATDVASARSLANTIFRVLYVVEEVVEL